MRIVTPRVIANYPNLVNHWIADAIYVGVLLIWLVPDRRIEART